MHKANWHAFTLLIDTTLLPMHHLLERNRYALTPRKIIHLPANDKSLKLRMRRIAEEGGSGGVIVMACDLNNARRILSAASKYEMMSGRFLWLWLDLKAELRPNEPGIISSHVLYNSPAFLATSSLSSKSNDKIGTLLDKSATSHLESLEKDIHRLQEQRWQQQHEHEHAEKRLKKREDRSTLLFEEDEEIPLTEKMPNSKSFMPVGMLALRASSLKITGGDTILKRMLRETSQALDNTFVELKSSLGRFRESQLKELFVPTCFDDSNYKVSAMAGSKEIKDNVTRTLTRKLQQAMRQISRDKAEFQLLNLQAVQFPGNKTQLR